MGLKRALTEWSSGRLDRRSSSQICTFLASRLTPKAEVDRSSVPSSTERVAQFDPWPLLAQSGLPGHVAGTSAVWGKVEGRLPWCDAKKTLIIAPSEAGRVDGCTAPCISGSDYCLVDRTRRMNPSCNLSNRLKINRNIWPCRGRHKVRFVGFYPLGASAGAFHCDHQHRTRR